MGISINLGDIEGLDQAFEEKCFCDNGNDHYCRKHKTQCKCDLTCTTCRGKGYIISELGRSLIEFLKHQGVLK